MGVQLLESAEFVNFIDDRIDTSQYIPLKAIIEAFHAPSSNGSGANDQGPDFDFIYFRFIPCCVRIAPANRE